MYFSMKLSMAGDMNSRIRILGSVGKRSRCCVNKLKPSLERRMVTRQPLLVKQRVAVTLWRLGTNVEFCTISICLEWAFRQLV